MVKTQSQRTPNRFSRTLRIALATVLAVAAGVMVQPAAAMALSNLTVNLGGGTLIGHEYEHINFGGAVLTYTAGADCTVTTGDVDFQTGSLPTSGGDWDDDISSFDNFAVCFTRHFSNDSFGGITESSFQSDSSSMQAGLNDVTNSVRWS